MDVAPLDALLLPFASGGDPNTVDPNVLPATASVDVMGAKWPKLPVAELSEPVSEKKWTVPVSLDAHKMVELSLKARQKICAPYEPRRKAATFLPLGTANTRMSVPYSHHERRQRASYGSATTRKAARGTVSDAVASSVPCALKAMATGAPRCAWKALSTLRLLAS